MQYFASFESFEIFEKFNGVPGWQIEKSILMLAKLTANQTKQAHPEIDTSSLEEVVRELMKDNSKN